MLVKTLILAALSVSVQAAATPPTKHLNCGTKPPTQEQLAACQLLGSEEAALIANGTIDARTTTDVDVYFHVVAASTSPSDGYIPASQIQAQLQVLRDTFAPSGIVFNYKGVDYTVNPTWAVDGDELAMKKALRKGSYRTLNVYFQKMIGNNYGYCYFPTTITPGSDDFFRDGCSILYTTVPGGTETNFNLGKTITHEVGHWFGLFHTFQGGCIGDGDGVKDTPSQESASDGCPVGRDSCPNQKGLDPIHNYMDYSYDACYEEFTKGQKRRMKIYWRHFRTAQS